MNTPDTQGAETDQLSLTEWVVLALLDERPRHGFAIAKELGTNADLGRILTVHRPLVYRALDRLTTSGYATAQHTEPGDAGPKRTLHNTTAQGHSAIEQWLDRPVAHVRDLRIEFLLKLRLNQRRRRDAVRLITAQRSMLEPTFRRLTEDPGGDVVDLWRLHSANAARAFLDDLG